MPFKYVAIVIYTEHFPRSIDEDFRPNILPLTIYVAMTLALYTNEKYVITLVKITRLKKTFFTDRQKDEFYRLS